MRTIRLMLALSIALVTLAGTALAAPFVLFPKAGELLSPDGRFAVRSTTHRGSPSDFIGTVQSLWLFEIVTGRSRKLCDYLGVAAVAWSGNDFVVVNEYVGRKTSRAWLFPVDSRHDAILLDKRTLTYLAPVEFRETLQQNEHTFVEATKVEHDSLLFRVWGYGFNIAKAFRLQCRYALRGGQITCNADQPAVQP